MEHFLIVARAHRLKHVAMWVGDHVILVVTGQAQETLAEAQTALIADGWKIESPCHPRGGLSARHASRKFTF